MRAGISKEQGKFVIRALEGAKREIASFWTYDEAVAYAIKYVWKKEYQNV